MHTNEAIWLVLERAWLEYKSRLTSHNIKTWLSTFYKTLYFLTIYWHFTKNTKNMKENITELIPDSCDENFDVLARNVQ